MTNDNALKLHAPASGVAEAVQEQFQHHRSSETEAVQPPHGKTVQPLFWSGPQLATALGISLASFHRHLAANRIGPKPVRLGGRVLYPAKECVAWSESRMPDGRLPNRREWEAIQASRKKG